MKHPLIFITAIFFIGVFACKKVQVATVSPPISNEESATMIAGSLASGSNGLTTFSSDASTTAQKLYSTTSGCGALHNDTIVHQSQPGDAITYNFKHTIVSKLICNSKNLPDNISSTLNCTGSYNGPKISATGTGTTTTTVTGLASTATAYILNGTAKIKNTFKLKPDTTRSGTIIIDIAIKNLTIAKATATSSSIITGGSATVTITGNSPKGAFLFDGNLTFQGYNEALLTLGSISYVVNLSSGVISKK